MVNVNKNERRASPRIHDSGFSISLKAEDFDEIIHTHNLSASGVYCKVSRELPLMSRINLVLMLPSQNTGASLKTLEINGVVVREHPVVINGSVKHYDVAIFFDDIEPKDRDAIMNYISLKRD